MHDIYSCFCMIKLLVPNLVLRQPVKVLLVSIMIICLLPKTAVGRQKLLISCCNFFCGEHGIWLSVID